MTRRPRTRLAPAALALALLAAACGGEASPGTTVPVSPTAGITATTEAGTTTGAASTTAADPVTTTSTTAAPATTAAFAGGFPGDTSDKSGSGGIGLLTGVRVGNHEDYVRVVFDFREPSYPHWQVGYVPGEVEGHVDTGSGWVEGEAFLVARFAPAGTADTREADPVVTYDGPRRIDVGVGSVVQLLLIEDFDAKLWWAIGLTGRRPFRVGTMTDPPRVFVDIAY